MGEGRRECGEGFTGGGMMKSKLRIWLINTLKWWLKKLGGNYELLDSKSTITLSKPVNIAEVSAVVDVSGHDFSWTSELLAREIGRRTLMYARVLKADSIGGPLDPPSVTYQATLRVIPFNDNEV